MNAKKKVRKPRVINCDFTTVWDNGTRITTDAKYYPKTGEVSAEPSGVDIDANLVDEYITLPDDTDTQIQVCMTCHEYVKKAEMNPGIGHDLNEQQVCSNPDCESHQ
jgi:hypothetical protein